MEVREFLQTLLTPTSIEKSTTKTEISYKVLDKRKKAYYSKGQVIGKGSDKEEYV